MTYHKISQIIQIAFKASSSDLMANDASSIHIEAYHPYLIRFPYNIVSADHIRILIINIEFDEFECI